MTSTNKEIKKLAMAKAELKTKMTNDPVMGFLQNQEDEQKRNDSITIHEMMESITGEKGKMWGATIVGYGQCHLKYESGRELDWMLTGFSPRKQNLTLYIMDGFARYDELMGRLGKHKTGKSCLYIKQLSDIDMAVLREMIHESVAHLRQLYDH